MKTFSIVAGWVKRDSKVLLLKRAATEKYYPGYWEPISGTIEDGEIEEDTMRREAREETGLNVQIIKTAPGYEVSGSKAKWVVKPYLLKANAGEVKIGREHSEFQWIEPAKAIATLQIVDGVDRDFELLGLI